MRIVSTEDENPNGDSDVCELLRILPDHSLSIELIYGYPRTLISGVLQLCFVVFRPSVPCAPSTWALFALPCSPCLVTMHFSCDGTSLVQSRASCKKPLKDSSPSYVMFRHLVPGVLPQHLAFENTTKVNIPTGVVNTCMATLRSLSDRGYKCYEGVSTGVNAEPEEDRPRIALSSVGIAMNPYSRPSTLLVSICHVTFFYLRVVCVDAHMTK
ncbi:hypothetical protein V8B97DRAFT_1290476 [Scleroderma yunnanense]